MRWYLKLGSWIFPARASTQTWLVRTFALFIGAAVFGVGVYVTVVIQNDKKVATEEHLYQQAERAAQLIERRRDDGNLGAILEGISRFSELELTIIGPDSVYLDVRPAGRPAVASVGTSMSVTAEEPVHFFEQRSGPLSRRVYIELYRPQLGAAVRIGQPEPQLLSLVRRMQVALVAGMTMALLLAILGSWIAANQVTRPLLAIRDSALRVAEGSLDESIRVETRAQEFHDVARGLNLMSEAYRQKIAELERLAQLQNEFIGNVSHEVKNPIFAVSGYLEALGSPSLDEKVRKRYAEKGLVNLERLNSLFSDLIEIARLEYREDLIRLSVFDFQELLDDVVEMLRPKAERKNIELVYDNKHLFVRADRNRIRQVLINLIDNAIAYSDAGAVRCRLRRHLEKVRIEVVDNGRGMDEDHLDRIFERFYRVDPDRSRKSGGTGLGLSIVRQIIQAHGEQIHVESTLGRGSRFWFELPYVDEDELIGD